MSARYKRNNHNIDYFINWFVNNFRFVEQQNSYNFYFNFRFDDNDVEKNDENFSQSRNYDFEYDYLFFDNQSRLT